MEIMESIISLLKPFDSSWTLGSLTFMAVFVVFFLFYLLIGRRQQLLRLLYVVCLSLLFAWKANGLLMLMLPLTAILVWSLGQWMKQTNGWKRKTLLWLTLTVELLPLLYFKYANFAISTFNSLLQNNFPLLDIALPIGISFYTFQAISYTVDIYRGKFTADCTLFQFLFYLTFFPLLMAGPITRAEVLIPQSQRELRVSRTLVYLGLWLILLGLLKKAVVADYIAEYNNWIFDDPAGYSGFECLMGALGYTVQIYCDFSGYSDMAIGVAALMGYRLKDNFNFPYQATNVAEFWHRWHIALSTWMRDYIYIPLGGNRGGKALTMLNNFITMIVAGLWHGASWMFVVWGAMHGAALVVYKLAQSWLRRLPNLKIVNCLLWLCFFVFINITWIFFRAPSMESAYCVLKQITTNVDWAYLVPFVGARPMWTLFVVLALLLHGIRSRWYYRMQAWFVQSPWLFKAIALLVVVQLVITFRQSNVQPFIYQQF